MFSAMTEIVLWGIPIYRNSWTWLMRLDSLSTTLTYSTWGVTNRWNQLWMTIYGNHWQLMSINRLILIIDDQLIVQVSVIINIENPSIKYHRFSWIINIRQSIYCHCFFFWPVVIKYVQSNIHSLHYMLISFLLARYREYVMESDGLRYLHMSCFCIRNRRSERSEQVRFLIQKQRVGNYHTKHFTRVLSLHHLAHRTRVPICYSNQETMCLLPSWISERRHLKRVSL